MSGLSIHEKRQLAEQLARELLNKSGQYRFGIPQSVLNAKANEFMRLSDKELQQKFNEYFQSTGLNAKPKDLWDSMGLNLEQKKKAQANMKSLQAQVNKKYMRPTSANTKKVGANQTTKPLPKDVKKEVRQFMITLLQQTYSQKVEEFRNYLLNNKTSFAELGMELHDLGAKVADGLTSVGVVVDRSDTRAEIREKLIDKQAKAEVLADYVDDEEMFNKLFKEYFNEDFDYKTTFDYICATNDFSTSDSSDKIEKFTKKLNNITKYSIKSADDYMKNASGAGGLLDLAFNVALMYASGGTSAIAKYAQMTAKGGAEVAGKVITNVAGKKIAQSTAGQAISQGVGIVAAQTTSAGLNAVAFQGTKVADLAGETLATGEFNTDKAENIVASAEGLFKFGYVGGAISGPLGMQVKNMTTKLLNSKPIINQILTKGITNKPTPLTSVLKDISEHSEAIGEVLKFGTEFGINAGYMAYDDGTSYTDAMANLAQMDGVSKMVLAMLGAKNMSFLTPEKVQQIKTDLAGYKVNIAVKGSQKVYSVKDAQGKETVLATPEELFMFILDKEAKVVGVKAETKAETKTVSAKETKYDATVKDVAPTETTGKKPHVKPEVKNAEFSSTEPVCAPETKVEGNNEYRANNIFDKVFDETTIPKSKSRLKEMGFTEDEINSIDLKDANVQRTVEVFSTLFNFKPEMKEEYSNADIAEFLGNKEELENFLIEEVKFFTEENCEILTKNVIFDEGGDITDIFRDYNNPEKVMNLLPILTQNGKHKVFGSQLKLLGYSLDTPENIAKITPEKIDLMYKINDQIENKKYGIPLNEILNIDNVNAELANDYVKEANRFGKYGIESISEKTLEETVSKRKAVSDFLEQYPIDLTCKDYEGNLSKLSGYAVYKLSQSTNKAEVQKFVNSLSTEARENYAGYSSYVDKGFSAEKLSKLINEYRKGDLGEIQGDIYKLLDVMLETGSKDYDSMIDLINAYKGTRVLSWYGNEKYVQVANGDYKGAMKYIELAKVLGMNEEHFRSLITDKNADFKTVEACLTYVKENKIDPSSYSDYHLLRDNNWKENIGKIEYLKEQGVNKGYMSTPWDSLHQYICTDLKSDISLKEFKEKFEYINDFINTNKGADYRGYGSDYSKIKFANSSLKMDEVKELQDLAKLANVKPTEFIELLVNVNKENFVFAEKLCADKEFPKEHVASILEATNKDNIAFAEKLCADKEFPKEHVASILNATNKDNIAFAEKLCADKDFSKEQVASILNATNKDNIAFAEKLCSDKEFPKEHIADILWPTNEDNIAFAEKLCADKDFPKEHVAGIVRATNKYYIAFAEKLCVDKKFPKEQVASILNAINGENFTFAEKLCADKDFPKEHVAGIVRATNRYYIPFAEKLCVDKDFPKEHIANILRTTNKDNITFAEKLCADKEFPKEHIASILKATNKDNIAFAEKLCADKEFPKEHVVSVLYATNKDNIAFAEKLCADKNIPKDKIPEIINATKINDPNDAGGNNGKTDSKKIDRYSRLFHNQTTAKWAGDMLKQGFDIETISKLAPTKQSFFTESVDNVASKQVVETQKALSPLETIRVETIQEFESIGLDTKQANAVYKAISKNGVVDALLKSKAIDLINKGVAKNKIGDILNSAQITGEFNSKIVDDFILLQNRGLNPLLEKNLAVLNNISGADCATKFNSKVRNQMKAMINNLPDAVKISLKEQGVEIDSILKKLDSQVVRTSNNVPTRAKVESGFRSKAKITGFERIVIDKYEPTEQVWRNEEATKKWAEEKYTEFKNREYVSTRNTSEDPQLGEKVTQKRKEMLQEWYNFMETDENIKNNPFVKVILCDFITKELEPERSTTPPVLDKDVVKQILGDAANSSNFSFSNAYAKKMKELSAKNSNGQQVEINGRKGTWYTVPKTDRSSQDFKVNAAKIRAFSDGTNWCIRTWNAEPYVQQGAMHFFVDENGLTQICIRESGAPGSVYEIQKRQQDQSAPVAYLDVIQSYMTEHELKPQNYCQGELDRAIAQKPQYDKLKSELDVLNNKKDCKGILEKMGIKVNVLSDGTFELSHYTSYIDKIALNDFGINENELLANVSKIQGNASFKDSNVTALPLLQEVGGNLDFGYANISNIKSLQKINGKNIQW